MPLEEPLFTVHKLEEWNRVAAVVTHEINNPLAAIQNLLFLMQMMPGMTPELAGITQQISDEVKRIEALTRLALGFLRERKEPEIIDLAAAAEGVRLLLAPTLRQRSLELELRQEGDCTIKGCGAEIRQALLELIRNACDASPNETKVTSSVSGRTDDVLILVEDQEAGIAPEQMGRIFEVDPHAGGKSGESTGLWLARRLIERHGGAIQVESAAEQGARFNVTLPRRAVQSQCPAQASTGSKQS